MYWIVSVVIYIVNIKYFIELASFISCWYIRLLGRTWGFSGGLVGVLTSHLAPVGGAFCHFCKSSVLMPHLSPGWGGVGVYID